MKLPASFKSCSPRLAAARGLQQRHCSARGGRSSLQARWAGTRKAASRAPISPARCEQSLENILAVLAEAQARPEHIVRLTWYVTSRDEYHAELQEIGAAYRAVMGRHFPAMSVVQVVALMEAQAKVEIEATAVIPHAR